MVSCSDDVLHMTDESSARIHRGRKAVRRGTTRTMLEAQLQDDPPIASGEANLQIPSTHLSKRNESYSYINLLRDTSKISFSAILFGFLCFLDRTYAFVGLASRYQNVAISHFNSFSFFTHGRM
ncbi:unnamed protein product [Protopolystoma xenopodis]|uniref:Uncharacterized protein n=1 Tax=Protopolystoma xenopodis TaxID=117903 RepID=A0A3S5B7D4_9PLAT|nr:unnamed protein product [Protopolystoma xenopodis]